MNKSLKIKLILSFLAVAIITVMVASLLIRFTSGQSLMNLVTDQQTAKLEEILITYYTENGSLDGFMDYYNQINQFDHEPGKPDDLNKPPQMEDIRGIHGLVDAEYRALLPMAGIKIGDPLPNELIKDPILVEVDGKTIAWILPDTKFQFTLNPQEELFLKRTTLAISFAALAGVTVAVIMGWLLANGLIKPIRKLTKASESLAHGQLYQKVEVTSQDELGQLTVTFNQMSEDLLHADEQRKRLTADITHDLSTPLQVISGYMEMIGGGEVSLTPQRIDIIKTEIEHLRRLVGDLTTLSQVEAQTLDIQLQPLQPLDLLKKLEQTYQPIAARKGVDLLLDVTEPLPAINVDEGRILQVLKNLLENALRYTPKDGKITLAARFNEKVILSVTDTGNGIDSDDLPYVFDRFYRADKSRGANSGKMGLGLAICKALVNTQGGEISAESAGANTGTSMKITFPAVQP